MKESTSTSPTDGSPVTRRTTRNSGRRPSYESDDRYPDPLEPLALALTVDLETEAEHEMREPITYSRSGATISSMASRPPDFEIVFEPDDPANPRNWSMAYRAWTIFGLSYCTWVVVVNSTSYTAAIPGVVEEFHTTTSIATLGVTVYLLGLAAGTLVVAPLSELYGRQILYIICLIVSTLLIIPCGLATSLTEILVVRFFGAFFGAAFVSNSPGSIVDISSEEYRALAMSLWSIAPFNGPVTGPLIGGFTYQYLGWRWDSWIVLILAGVGVLIICTLRETYAPTILQRIAAKKRKEMDDPRWWCRYDQRVSSLQLIKINLSRPFILCFTEPILWLFNIWLSLIYAILYLCFVAYPVVFGQHRGWKSGFVGLAFLGIGLGTIVSIMCEPLCRRIINKQARDPATGKLYPEASGLIMTIGAILTPIGQLGFAWTCLPTTIHWAVPISFGLFFGAGNTLCFIYGSNYLATSYGIYSASAMAGNAVLRSIAGGTLPLAGPTMYQAMSPQWAGTLMGLLEVVIIPIPLAFWLYGARIRAKSPLIRRMREDFEKNEGRRAKQKVRMDAVSANNAALTKGSPLEANDEEKQIVSGAEIGTNVSREKGDGDK